MKALAAVLVLALAACAGRQVEVGTGPATAATEASVSLRVTNTLSTPVNVYVVQSGQETFVRQIGAQSTEQVSVQGVSPGATVTLRARQVDGRQVYDRPNVTLSGGIYDWRVP